MKALATSWFVLALATFVMADPVTPGILHQLKVDDKEVNAKPGDMVLARIPNPALPKGVTELNVSVTGGVKLVGAFNAEEIRDGSLLPGGTQINVYVSVEKGQRSGTLEFSYKDDAGKKHERKITVQIEGEKK